MTAIRCQLCIRRILPNKEVVKPYWESWVFHVHCWESYCDKKGWD